MKLTTSPYRHGAALAAAMALALLYMHYTVVGTKMMWQLNALTNLASVMLDVSIVAWLYFIGSRGRRWAILIPVLMVTAYSLCNVWYSRVFGSYMPLAAFTQTQNLHGLGDSIVSCIRWWDFVMIGVVAAIAWWGSKQTYTAKPLLSTLKRNSAVCIAYFVLLLLTRIADIAIYGNLSELRDHADGERASYSNQPNLFEYKFGVTIKLALDVLHSHATRTLTTEEQDEIEMYVDTRHFDGTLSQPKRILFIIVESLVTTPIDMKVDGCEVTPTLNQLAHSSTYYPNMRSQVQCGGSSDGQFIYMTGLLPLQSGITIVNYNNNVYSALGHAAEACGMKSMMVNPATHDFWMQDIMCQRYAVEQYAIEQYAELTGNEAKGNMLQDDEIFDYTLALCKLHRNTPLFITVLTYSMHLPYDANDRMGDYLRKVHFTDEQLGEFLTQMNDEGLMDGTVVVIASDHHAPTLCDNDREQMLPFMVHGNGIPVAERNDTVGQIDVFPTLLHLMGCDKAQWKGLGQSLLNDSLATSNEGEQLHLSRMIIESNWLK